MNLTKFLIVLLLISINITNSYQSSWMDWFKSSDNTTQIELKPQPRSLINIPCKKCYRKTFFGKCRKIANCES